MQLSPVYYLVSFCIFCFLLFLLLHDCARSFLFFNLSPVAPPPFCMCSHTPVLFSVLPACKFSVPCVLDFFLWVVRPFYLTSLLLRVFFSFFLFLVPFWTPFPSCPRSAPDPKAGAERFGRITLGTCLHSQRLQFDTDTGHQCSIRCIVWHRQSQVNIIPP